MAPQKPIKGIDVFIPKTLPCGIKINAIGSHFAFGVHYGTITISDEITDIHSWAFSRVEAKGIVWSAMCLKIPSNCFSHCKTSTITNLDAVTSVDDYAFCESDILTMSWPDNCPTIPRYCFKGSKIGLLHNLGGVSKINIYRKNG